MVFSAIAQPSVSYQPSPWGLHTPGECLPRLTPNAWSLDSLSSMDALCFATKIPLMPVAV